ncbi:hypothetical protein BZA77DRAFT_339240 [Pyronema omphalodes]|nr:hypothetical protein BZA77DRAFT_339240 [Pyronema omphalodes]
MDIYDHQYQESHKETLNEEFQSAYKAISNSPWGARFGAFVGNVRKQGESYIEVAKKEYPAVAEQAQKGITNITTNIVNRTRALSIGQNQPRDAAAAGAQDKGKEKEESLLQRLKVTAEKKIAEIEEAEKRADAYLLKFGESIGGFLRDAVTIAPPSEKDGDEVVFEAKGAEDQKKQIFTTRLDAQLHLLHTNLELFKTDSKTDNFTTFSKDFSVDKETERIAADLERYPELRSTMEKLVPAEVEYKPFWIRYYFLRNELDLEEKKRKELLKGAINEEEDIGWDEDDSEDENGEDEESEGEEEKAPEPKKPVPKASTDTLQPKPNVSTSNDRSSQPDSEASYDVVSGAASKTGSPPRGKMERIRANNARLTERAQKAAEDESAFEVAEQQRKQQDSQRRLEQRRKQQQEVRAVRELE